MLSLAPTGMGYVLESSGTTGSVWGKDGGNAFVEKPSRLEPSFVQKRV